MLRLRIPTQVKVLSRMASPRHSGRSTSLVRLLFIVALVAAIVASSVLGADAAEDTSNRKAPANRHKSGNFKDAMLHPEILDNHAKLVDGKDVGKETKWQITAPVTPVDGTEILDLALEDRILYDRLLSFMKAESSGENLMFLHDLLNYKAVPPVPLEDGREDTSFLVPYANFLYEEYVYPDKAPYEINLSGPNLAELKAAYESGEWKRNSFDSAAIEITNLIVKDVIMRFKTKDEGKFYKAAFGDWAARIDTELKRIKMMLDDERRFWQPRVHKTDVEVSIQDCSDDCRTLAVDPALLDFSPAEFYQVEHLSSAPDASLGPYRGCKIQKEDAGCCARPFGF